MKASGTKKRKLPVRNKVVAPAKFEEKPVFDEDSQMVESQMEGSMK